MVSLQVFKPMASPSYFIFVILLIIFLVIVHSLTTIIYNLWFHPLRRWPGPFFGRISGAWARVQNFYGRKAHKIHEAHRKYGPVVRIGPNMLSFSDPQALRDIYTSKAFVKEKTFYQAKRIYQEEHLLSFTDPEAHSARRKLLSRGYSQGAMKNFEPKVASKVNTLLKKWAQLGSDGSVVDIFPWVHMLGFDTVYDLMFDIDPETVKTGVESEVMSYMRAWKPTYIYKEFVPQLERWGPYVPGYVGEYFRQVRKWKTLALSIVRSVKLNGQKTAFLSRVLDEDESKTGTVLTDSILAEECMSGMFGGSGTTANTFVYLVWATIRHPEVHKHLKKELQQTFHNKDTVPDHQMCATLPYLNAVIHETMRMYPATIAILPRTATVDTVVAGIPIQKGTNVGTQNYTIHRCETVFPEPESFKPERWLVDDVGSLKEAFTPFSIGPRRCIGLNLAQMELRILTASFFLRFDASIHPSMTEKDMVQYDTFNAAPVGGKLLVCLEKVSGSTE
ncbi:benzoate 4-monooxygenase [Xylogone sp. PMI_703]|nr:benzoate 4-monooxygenase [Xylogone sp. PMI_703]